MSGLEFLRAIRDGRLPAAPMALLLGFRLVEVDPGEVAFEVVPRQEHYNPLGTVHGGLAMTLLDSAMACAVLTHLAPGVGYTTVEAKINLVRPISSETGRLRALGKTLHVGSRIATAEGRLEDDAGKLFAHGTTTCIVLNGR